METRFIAELAEVEGHVIAGDEHIGRQHEIIRRLERAGRGKSETAKIARDLLHSMQLAQRAHIAHRDQLRSLVETERRVPRTRISAQLGESTETG